MKSLSISAEGKIVMLVKRKSSHSQRLVQAMGSMLESTPSPARDVVRRLAGKTDKAVRQLNLTYGGGKTHRSKLGGAWYLI